MFYPRILPSYAHSSSIAPALITTFDNPSGGVVAANSNNLTSSPSTEQKSHVDPLLPYPYISTSEGLESEDEDELPALISDSDPSFSDSLPSLSSLESSNLVSAAPYTSSTLVANNNLSPSIHPSPSDPACVTSGQNKHRAMFQALEILQTPAHSQQPSDTLTSSSPSSPAEYNLNTRIIWCFPLTLSQLSGPIKLTFLHDLKTMRQNEHSEHSEQKTEGSECRCGPGGVLNQGRRQSENERDHFDLFEITLQDQLPTPMMVTSGFLELSVLLGLGIYILSKGY